MMHVEPRLLRGGMLPQKVLENLYALRLFLMASEDPNVLERSY